MIRRVVALALAASFPIAANAQAQQPVRTETGLVRGVAKDGVESFKGIAFAAPPVGALRWRAPQPPRPWKGVRNASEYGFDCAQTPFPGDAAPLASPLSEDCLNLSLWRPASLKRDAKLPVLAWIHGGGFVNGGISPAIFAGDAFARDGVMLVGINYRVGRFGFFAHPALRKADEDQGRFGNYGIMDQIAALRWIQRNIAAFGGDPGNVTIMGESAGGASVQMLLTSAEAKGLFHRAIIQSGGGRTTGFSNRRLDQDLPGVPSLQTTGNSFALQNGIEGDDASALARLRAIPRHAVEGQLNMATTPSQRDIYGGPSIDGRFVTGPFQQLYLDGRFAHVPIIIGATNADLGIIPAKTKAEAFALFGDRADRAKAIYDPDGTASDRSVIAAIGADRMQVEPARFVADSFARKGVPAYIYRFSYVAAAMRSKWPGAVHASEVPYIMGTVDARYGAQTIDQDRRASDRMHLYWVNFAKTGNPNGPSLPVWNAYSTNADAMMEVTADGDIRTGADPWRKRLDLVCAIEPISTCPAR